ncbi:MAG: hypothetical protein ACI4I7_05505 [Oscillospiraceae bacterium]
MADKKISLSAKEIEDALILVNRIETGTAFVTTSGGMQKTDTIPYQKYHDNPTVFLTVKRNNPSYSVNVFVTEIETTAFSYAIVSPSLGMASSAVTLPIGMEFEVQYLIVG